MNEGQTKVIAMMGELSSKSAEGWNEIFNVIDKEGGEFFTFLSSLPGEIQSSATDVLEGLSQKIQENLREQRQMTE